LDSISRQLIEANDQKKLYETMLAEHKSLIDSLERGNAEQKALIVEMQERIIALEKSRKANE
jgi:hypothetical protein